MKKGIIHSDFRIIFDDTEDFYHVMDSDEMHDFFLSTEDEGFVTLTYYTSGARSF